ncbi:uncharacterized protein [Ptychodera flava]|uniref:uncharacterized protein n=1 Tax=Ptychodera flava TaxID=63121 RepID=UPI00396A30F9
MYHNSAFRYFVVLNITVATCILSLALLNLGSVSYETYRFRLSAPSIYDDPWKRKTNGGNGTSQIQRLGKSFSTEIYTSETHKPIKSIQSNNGSERYLLYINAYQRGGPNCQYNHFFDALTYCVMENRSLVDAVRFFAHHLFNDGTMTRRFLQETFDLEILRQIVDIVSLERFKRECNNTVDIVLTTFSKKHNKHENAYNMSAKMYLKAFGIHIPGFETLPTTENQTKQRIVDASSMKCVGVWVLRPDAYQRIPTTVNDLTRKHVVNSPNIRATAEWIANKTMEGEPYITMHWRSKARERYAMKCAGGRIPKRGNCDVIGREVITTDGAAAPVAKAVRELLMQYNVRFLYVATPPVSSNIVEVLRNEGIRNVFSAENITVDENPSIARMKLDNYTWSLVEEQICINSKIFIGQPGSTWSSAVVNARKVAANRTSIPINRLATTVMAVQGILVNQDEYEMSGLKQIYDSHHANTSLV